MVSSAASASASAPVRAVIFDLDETLFDHAGSTRQALTGWLPTLGATSDPSLVTAWFDLESEHFEAWRVGLISFDEQRRRRVRDFLPLIGRTDQDDDEFAGVFAGYLEWYQRSWTAFSDVRPTVDALAAQEVVVAVLTNGTHEQQNAKVAAIGLEDDLAAVVTSEELGVAKPAPEAYLAACRQLRLEPGQILHVGDRHDLDVVAVRRAGLHALHLDRHQQHAEPPVGRISTLGELPGRLSAS